MNTINRHTQNAHKGIASLPLIVLLTFFAIGGGYYFVSSQKSDVDDQLVESTDALPIDPAAGTRLAGDPTLEEDDAERMASDGTAMPLPLPGNQDVEEMIVGEVSDPLPLATGSFEAYSESKLALAETGDVILFFHAPWCPSCRALENDVNANLSKIPDGVHLLKVDYDSETALKKKYGVVRQHTLVQVDESGNVIKNFTGLNNTLAQVVAQIN